jgi:hypothetical protein
MSTITKPYNPLINISDEQWLRFIDLVTENVFALNSRALAKVELLHSEGGHYPAVYFRLTTVDYPVDDDPQTEVSGFVLGFNNEWDDDVYIHPLSEQGFWKDWLVKNGITATFNYHEVGLRKLLFFLAEELKLWEVPGEVKYNEFLPDVWRELPYQPAIT